MKTIGTAYMRVEKKRKKETNKEQADPRALERFHKKAYSTSTDVLGYLQKVKRRKKK